MASLLGCSLAAILIASSGAGTQAVDTTIQDDAVLLHRSDAEVSRAVRQMRDLGVDRVRITAGWSALAPAPRKARRPRDGFDPANSATYPQAGFAALDRAVRTATRQGLKVQLDLAFWAPRWAVQRKGENPERERFAPDPGQFAKFSTAVARRYTGSFTDGRHGVVLPLPRVDMYTTWNEPNKATFLMPQWVPKRRSTGFRPYSPHVFRPMHEQAYEAIKQVDPNAVVLLAGLNSRGSKRPGTRGVAPLAFLRTLACVRRNGQPLRVPECEGVGRIRADGLSLHPYSMHVPPATSAPQRDNVYLADLGRVNRLIAQLADAGRIDGRWPLYITEYGYESKPPDPTARFSPAEQARYLGWATYLANNDPSVKLFAQFLLRDVNLKRPGPGVDKRRNDFQTGLLFADGVPKPAASAFKLPLFATFKAGPDGTPGLVLYGGVRPARGPEVVRLEKRVPGTEAWVPVTTLGRACGDTGTEFLTERSGFFRRAAAWDGPGTYRLAWYNGSKYDYSQPLRVDGTPLLG